MKKFSEELDVRNWDNEPGESSMLQLFRWIKTWVNKLLKIKL